MLFILNLLFQYLKTISAFSLAFLLVTSSVSSQSKGAPDWEESLKIAKGQDRIDLIVKLSKDLAKEDLVMADSVSKEGIALAKEMGDSLSMHRIGANLGELYYLMNEVDKGTDWTGKSLTYFESDKDLAFDKAKAQLNLAFLYIKKRNYSQVDSFISESSSFFEKTDDDLFWLSKTIYARGLLSQRKQEYKQALVHLYEALEISRRFDDTDYTVALLGNISIIKKIKGLYPEALELQFEIISMDIGALSKSKCYNFIGDIYIALKDWKPAIKYTQMAIDLAKKVGSEGGLSNSLNNMGIIHFNQLNYGEALGYYEECLRIQEKFKMNTSTTLGNIGNVYHQIGKYSERDKYYDMQLVLAEAQNDWGGIWSVNYNRGFTHFEAEENEEALKYLLKSYEIAVEKGHLHSLVSNNGILSDVYKALGDKEKSKYHEEQYHFYQDSISSVRRIKKIGALEQKHLSELQEDSLNSVNGNDKTAARSNGFSDQIKTGIGSGLFILIVFLSFLFVKRKTKKEPAPAEIREPVSSGNTPLDQTKIDQYFEQLFARLDQTKTASEKDAHQSAMTNINPIYDMAEYLKTNLSTEKDWASFEHYFKKVHKDFFKNLKSAYPTISINELNLCALIKLNLRSKDIAQIMGISPDSVRKAQNRLSKKLGLSADENLRDFVLKQ